jgi:hypothetical protein
MIPNASPPLTSIYLHIRSTTTLPVAGGSGVSARRACLPWSHVGGLKSLSSLLDVELDGLALLQGLQPAGLHRDDVHEYIFALLGSDEAVALLGSNHLTVPLAMTGCLLHGAKWR